MKILAERKDVARPSRPEEFTKNNCRTVLLVFRQAGTAWLHPLLTILFLLSTYAGAWGVQPAGSMDLAREYFEAGNYSHAKAVYEELQDDRLPAWQKNILDYNIATTLLADGNYDEAALSLEILADGNISLPLLKQRVLSNLALAKFGQLESRFSALLEDTKSSHDDYNRLYVAFRGVLADIAKAEAAGCTLEKIEGAESCPESLNIQEMRSEVKNRFDQFQKDYLAFHLKHLSLQDGVSELLIGEKMLLKELEKLQKADTHPQNHSDEYLQKGNNLKPFWNRLAEILKSRSKEANAGAQRALLEKAEQQFTKSLSLAGKGDFHESARQMEDSRAALNTLLEQLISQSPVREVLQQLLVTYGYALVNDPLRDVSLEQILEIQTALGSFLKQGVEAEFLEDYKKAQSYLKQGVQALEDSYPVKARLFAEVARFYAQELLEQIDYTPKTQAHTVLENVIAKQEFILLLNHLSDQVRVSEKGLDEIDPLMVELQASVLGAADYFLAVVLARQAESFKGDARCQCRPWDEVIPLFSEGYSKASLAERYLKNGNFKDSIVGGLQKSAVEKWKEALVKMRAKSTSKKQSSQQEEQKNEDQPQSKDQDRQQQDIKLNETLRLVQEMENDDRSTPQQVKTVSGSSKGEERPW